MLDNCVGFMVAIELHVAWQLLSSITHYMKLYKGNKQHYIVVTTLVEKPA